LTADCRQQGGRSIVFADLPNLRAAANAGNDCEQTGRVLCQLDSALCRVRLELSADDFGCMAFAGGGRELNEALAVDPIDVCYVGNDFREDRLFDADFVGAWPPAREDQPGGAPKAAVRKMSSLPSATGLLSGCERQREPVCQKSSGGRLSTRPQARKPLQWVWRPVLLLRKPRFPESC